MADHWPRATRDVDVCHVLVNRHDESVNSVEMSDDLFARPYCPENHPNLVTNPDIDSFHATVFKHILVFLSFNVINNVLLFLWIFSWV